MAKIKKFMLVGNVKVGPMNRLSTDSTLLINRALPV